MKNKIFKLSLFLIIVVSSFSVQAAGKNPFVKKAPTEQEAQRLSEIQVRINEIKAIDKSNLTKEERKELRKELTAIKKEARRLSGGFYFAAGAIVVLVIVLLLVL
jgi:Skp family chaperone for outer membrane proteins